MTRILIVCLAIFLIGCETEKERIKRLQKEEDRINREYEKAYQEYKRYEEQQENVIYATAKERFAYLYDLKKYNGQPLEHYDYIKKVQFREEGSNKYKAIVRMYSASDLKPNFYIFLHNEKGIKIGEYYYHSAIPFFGKLKKLQTTEKEISIKTEGQPSYFRIELVY